MTKLCMKGNLLSDDEDEDNDDDGDDDDNNTKCILRCWCGYTVTL